MPRRTDVAIQLLGGALLMAQAARLEASDSRSDHERTEAAVAACGVPAANVRIAYEDELQSDVVGISDLGGADEAKFRCLGKAVRPTDLIWIADAEQRSAYYAFEGREDQRRFKAEAIEGLKAAGRLDRLPRFDGRKGLGAFARALEAECGIRAGRALETRGSSGLTIRRRFFGKIMTTKIHDELTCLLRMFAASNADEHDILLAFTGAEAPSDGRP